MGCDGLDVDGFNVGKVSGVGSSAEGSSRTTGGVDREEATTAEYGEISVGCDTEPGTAEEGDVGGEEIERGVGVAAPRDFP